MDDNQSDPDIARSEFEIIDPNREISQDERDQIKKV